LLNAVDTTNGYVLERVQIEAVPLPTGSFTGLAILSPGVSAELPSGTGANSGNRHHRQYLQSGAPAQRSSLPANARGRKC
jgi:hypothetical protein